MSHGKDVIRKDKPRVFSLLRPLARIFGKGGTDVYFISGMCYNCSVFDKLRLPKGFNRKYIEWYVPAEDESLAHYARQMAKSVDTSRNFVLVGYSFGAVIMQEMDRFLNPRKSIIISSFKSKEEIPPLFSIVKRTHLTRHISKKIYSATDFITNAFNRVVYNTTTDELSDFMTVTHPTYVKWAVEQITGWMPDYHTPNLYHIHGTDDQVFPFRYIKDVLPVEGGDHLMLVKKAPEVSALLCGILLKR